MTVHTFTDRIDSNLTESDWIESESIRALMTARGLFSNIGLAIAMICIMAIQMYGHLNTWLILTWWIVSIVILIFRRHVKIIFNDQWNKETIVSKSTFVKNHALAWTFSAFTWGLAGWLFFTNIPSQNKYLGAIILIFVGFVSIINLYKNYLLARQFINILMGTQVLGSVCSIAYIEAFKASQIQYIHLLNLIVIWLLLDHMYKRFNKEYRKTLSLRYKNHNLIKNLNRHADQLNHEKQIAINANEVIQRFYSSAAHDIRQPVYALKVYSEIAMEDASQIPQLMPKMMASCDEINALFASLFDFDQVNSGHVNVAHQTVDIYELIEDIEQHFKPLAHSKNLSFRTRVISGYLQTDELLVKRILTCFISNAIKYTEKGGILVAVRMKETGIDMEVWDTGIGIDAVHQEHVFEEFYKVGDFSSKDEGFGLGLSMVNKLSAYAENSKISMKSRLGKGSMFRFTLPLNIFTPPFYHSEFRKSNLFPLVVDHELT